MLGSFHFFKVKNYTSIKTIRHFPKCHCQASSAVVTLTDPGTLLCSEDAAVEGGLGGFYAENGPVFDGCPKIQGAKCRSVIREYLQTGRYS